MPLLSRPLGLREANLADAADFAAIERFVRAQPDATPFHLPQWSVAIARACRQRARYLVVEGADGTLAGVLPLTEMRSPLFGSALVSAAFGTAGGVLADTPEAVTALATGSWELAGRLGIGAVELRGGPVPDDEWLVNDTSYVGFVRDLAVDEVAELKAIPRNRRHTVRRALSYGFGIVTGSGPAAAATHYGVYAESVRNLGTPVYPRALFQEVLAALPGEADVLTVRDHGRPVASVLNLYFNGTVFPYWGGSTTAGRQLLAADMMYFALMGHARNRGCTRYDFGRSKAGTGTAAYKGYWGFKPEPLVYASRVRAGQAARVVNPNSPRYRLQVAAWKKLPLRVANLVGPHLSRGLG